MLINEQRNGIVASALFHRSRRSSSHRGGRRRLVDFNKSYT